jgi:hypothetical protein
MKDHRAPRVGFLFATIRRAGAWVLLAALPNRADALPGIGLSYDADAACPDGETFAKRIGTSVPTVELEVVDPYRADVNVVLRSADGSFKGTLRIHRADGNDYVREMAAPTCEELASALAFVAALALSARQDSTPEPPLPPPSVGPVPEEPVAAAAPPPVQRQTQEGIDVGLAVGLGIRFGLAPTFANTEEIDLEVAVRSGALFAPRARLGVLHAEPVTRIDRFGTTEFRWIAARLAGCPMRVRLVSELELFPCAGVDMGLLGASGVPASSVGQGHDALPVWVGTFAAVRARLRLLGPLFAVAEAELSLPLTHYEFVYEPGAPVYQVPALAGAGLAGLFGQIP